MDNSHEKHNFSNALECIYYPARVQNVSKAVLTLGGRYHMSEVLNQINQKLELKFRPDDPYCKATSGVRSQCTGFVVKVKIIKKRKKSGKQTMEIVPQVLGTVSSWFQFRNLCDYQYLPVKQTKTGDVDDFLPSILFKNFTQLEHFSKNVELFLPPVLFSRMDTPQTQLKLFHDVKTEEDQGPDNVISMTRRSRESFTNVISFEWEGVPQPVDIQPRVDHYARAHMLTPDDVEAVRRLFDERPILSKNAIRARTTVPHRKIKLILPLIAYYFYTGPYRVMWVRLGYDPRRDTGAASYQVLDFRLRNAMASMERYQLTTRRMALLRLAFKAQKSHQQNEDPEGQLPERYSVFRPGYLPPFKQMLYQLCDIEIPEVRDLLASAPLREKCHEKYGWYPDTLLDQVRTYLTKFLLKTLVTLEEESGGGDTKDDSSLQMEYEEDLDEEEDEELDTDSE